MIEHSTFAPTQRRSWPSYFLEKGYLEDDLEGRYVIDVSCKQVLHEPCAGRKLLRNPFQYHHGPLRLPMRTPYALPLSFVSERLPGDETFQAMERHCKVDVFSPIGHHLFFYRTSQSHGQLPLSPKSIDIHCATSSLSARSLSLQGQAPLSWLAVRFIHGNGDCSNGRRVVCRRGDRTKGEDLDLAESRVETALCSLT